MEAFQRDAEENGTILAMNTSVVSGRMQDYHGQNSWLIETESHDSGNFSFPCDYVVNSSGLAASRVATALGVTGPPKTYYAKGNYYALSGYACNPTFRHLVYPVPEDAGLGVHATIDLAGRVRFGPDVEWVESPNDYTVDPDRAKSFYEAIRRYWPALPDGSLVPDYCGIRPKLQAPGESTFRDFSIQTSREHGLPGLVNLLGIESPGLTASLAIAKYVSGVLLDG
eukprot:CAMPEP_0172648658 /NCGR_PEP_ID=MMETSP1068-20121228/241387_1 /TAXON_ID=35684 /ORGANISM="Pseudopedinella elastica, Strain CCMP716" /LENGTH=225 /DNA_ID=CAMNT_0013462987 /DNA_START=56 /DNA_END=734 /DNA_ORIENTATION=-